MSAHIPLRLAACSAVFTLVGEHLRVKKACEYGFRHFCWRGIIEDRGRCFPAHRSRKQKSSSPVAIFTRSERLRSCASSSVPYPQAHIRRVYLVPAAGFLTADMPA